MRYSANQMLTWGTIAGAVGSAFLLAAFDRSTERNFGAIAIDPLSMVQGAPIQAAPKGAATDRQARPSPAAAASAPHADDR